MSWQTGFSSLGIRTGDAIILPPLNKIHDRNLDCNDLDILMDGNCANLFLIVISVVLDVC